MTSKNKNKKTSAWLAAGALGTMAIAIAGFSTPASAKPSDERWGQARGQEQRADRGAAQAQAREQRQAPQPRVEAPRPRVEARPEARAMQQQRPQWRGRPDAGEVRAAPVAQERRFGQRGDAMRNEAARNEAARQAARNDGQRGTWARGNEARDPNRRDGDRRQESWRNNGRNDGNRDRWDRDTNRREGWRDNDRRDSDHRGDLRQGDRRWGDRDGHRSWDRNHWRNDSRYNWQTYRDRNRSAYRIGRYYSPYNNYSYRRLGIGFSLGSLFYSNRYWINDPWQYRLPEVYGPYRWVRYYDDVLLVDTYTGEVVDVIYDFFW